MVHLPTPKPGGGWNWWAALGLATVFILGTLGALGKIKLTGQSECEAQGGVLVGANLPTKACLTKDPESLK